MGRISVWATTIDKGNDGIVSVPKSVSGNSLHITMSPSRLKDTCPKIRHECLGQTGIITESHVMIDSNELKFPISLTENLRIAISNIVITLVKVIMSCERHYLLG